VFNQPIKTSIIPLSKLQLLEQSMEVGADLKLLFDSVSNRTLLRLSSKSVFL